MLAGASMLNSGLKNLFQLVAGWMFVLCAGAFVVVYFDEVRTTLGLKLTAEDFGITAEASKAPAETQVRTEIRYIDRPREETPNDRPRQARVRSGSSGSVELSRHSDGHFHAEAYINGRPVNVLLDTGATLVAMSYEDARSAGISVSDSDFTHWSSTANGRARFAPVTLDDVRIGDVVVRNVRAAVSEPGRLDKTLLGMSFLGQTRMQMHGTMLSLEQ
jgi:aspartyl protease family protein